MDEDAVVLTQNDDKVVDTVEDRLEGLNFSNNDPGEDQEEGELSEKEDMNEEIKAAEPDIEEDVGVNVEVASKRIKHNLDDLSGRATMGLRGKDDYSQRSGTENLGKDNEDNLWLRDKMTFRSAATSYAPNLYNFAWAQAVQGNQGFKLVEKQDGDEEADALPDNGASFDGDDEMEDGLPESLADMTLKIPEGYDMRQVLYDRRLMTNASWNSRLGDTRREKTWIDSEDGMDSRRRFDRDERGGSRSGGGGRREMRSPSRRRDSRSERERGGVKSRLSEFERQRARDRERERENGRERGERNDNILRPTSSDESDYSRRNAPSGAIGRQSQSNDNIVDVREEGEIEEGEIELPTDNLRSRSSSREKSQDPRAESLIEDGISNGNLRKSLSSRLSFRNSSSSHPRSLSRESSFRRLQDGDLRHRLTKDVEREKPRQDVLLREDRREQIAHLTAVMKSVTVKDAQKAFINTCLRLDNAVKILQAFAMQRIPSSGLPADDIPRDLSKMATKVFQGLRAVYAVWNTANGREQERDRDTFPRLLQFVTESCLTYFSPKQARELEVFMDHVTKTARKIRMEGSLWHAQAVMKSAEAMQEPGVREREFVNASVSNSKMAPSGASTLEGNSEHNADSKDAIAEATIAAAALAYAQSSAAALANFTHGSTYNQSMKDHPIIGMDHWAWNGSNGPFERSMSPGLPPGYSGVSHAGRSLVAHGAVAHINSSTNSHGVAARPPNTSANGWISANKKLAYDAKSPYGPGFLEEDWEELSPPSQAPAYEFTTRKVVKLDERGFSISSSETINTFAPPSKMGNLPVSVNFRLASPTPSDGDDDHENQNTASAGVNGQLGHKPLHSLPKPSSSMPPVTSPFYKTSNTHVDDTGRVHYASAPMVSPASVDQELSLNFEQPKNQPVSGPVLSSLRSRDPRKQLQNGYLEAEGSLHQSTAQIKYQWPSALQTMDKKREGETYANMTEPSKRLKLLGSSNGMQNANLFASTSAIGGWLDEGAVVSAGHENHGAQSMDIDFDSPTPSERKHCLKDEFPGMNSNISEVSSASGSFEMLVSGTAASTRDKPPSDPFTSNSTNPEDQTGEEDVGRHRMRPRDPRRILLENAVETAQVNPMNVPVNDAAGSEMTLQYTNRSPEVADVSPNLNNQPSTNTLGNPPNQRDPRLNPYESSQSDSAVVSIQLSTEHKTTEWKTLDERIKESERDSNRNQGSEVSSGESTGDKGDHLHPWDPLLRKPRFGPSHWGGNDMHRDFEQLLEDLDEKQRIAIQNERKRRLQEQDRMFIAGKLCLVLDLDHTLLNSAKFSEIEPEWEARLRQAENMERSRALKDPSMKHELYRFPHMSMWTKLRPGIWKFLAKASELYELHVYTMGNKAYATEMAKLLDPTGTLFAGRVISKGDEVDGSDKSKDLDGVLGMESAVVIIDDSSRVWPHHRENLIVVERYMYFPSSRRQFGLLGPSLLEVGHDERAADGMLSSASGVIDRIHKNFFSNKRLREVDVRAILAAEQRRVLDGCRVLFSRIFPVGEANPHLHPLWRLAEQFGASCCLHINDKVTHVVAISLGTDKVNWAAATGRPVVRPAWLEASAILYRRANEQDFPVLP